jgi:phosphohistidine phosphatase
VATEHGKLVLLRHAKSDWPDGVEDIQRPLAERGRRDAPVAGRWLREHVPDLDLAVVSPANRARQTWELVSAELPATPEMRIEPRLYGESAHGMLAVARELPEQARSVLFVAHNPDLEDLVTLLTGSEATMKTSTVAVLERTGDWADSGPRCATLGELQTPRG